MIVILAAGASVGSTRVGARHVGIEHRGDGVEVGVVARVVTVDVTMGGIEAGGRSTAASSRAGRRGAVIVARH